MFTAAFLCRQLTRASAKDGSDGLFRLERVLGDVLRLDAGSENAEFGWLVLVDVDFERCRGGFAAATASTLWGFSFCTPALGARAFTESAIQVATMRLVLPVLT